MTAYADRARRPLRLTSTPSPMVLESITTSDGATLVYRRRRPGRPVRVVLVHSLGLDGSFWDRLTEALGDSSDVVVYDCRGHGASTKGPGPYEINRFADDLADLLDGLGWETAVVAGASMGGMVSQAFGIRHPDRTSGLCLIDTTAWYGENASDKWETRARQAEEDGMDSLIPFQLDRWFGEEFMKSHPDVVGRLTSVFLANDVPSYAASCRMLGTIDLREGLPSLQSPTSVVVGEDDYATPVSMAESLSEAIPDSTLHLLPGARHLTPVERPDHVAEILLSLFDAARR